jgi:LPS sulfotransferase NodH
LTPRLTYLICATPRTGSSMLCEALHNTGLVGDPDEYFSVEMEKSLYKELGVSTFAEFFQRILAERTSANGVFGAKVMMPEFYPYFLKHLRATRPDRARDLTDAQLLAEVFPNLRYIWVTRRDKVRQAVSLTKAIQTDVWERRIHAKGRQPVAQAEYRYEGLNLLTQRILIYEAMWQDYFARNGIKVRTVVYEDFVETYEETTLELLRYIGVDVPAGHTFRRRAMVRQADEQSETFVRRFMSEKSEKIMHGDVGPDTQW